MLFKMLTRLMVLLVSVYAVAAEGATELPDFSKIAEDISVLFSVSEVEVVQVNAESASLRSTSTLPPGIRIRLLRKGTAFVHPVTKQAIGEGTRDIGAVEVVAVAGGDQVAARIIEGSPAPGDVGRVPQAGIRLFIAYDALAHPRVVDGLYGAIERTGRFLLFDGGAGEVPDRLKQALSSRADAMVYVSTTHGVIRVSLFFPGSPKEEPAKSWEYPYTPSPVHLDKSPDLGTLNALQWHKQRFDFSARHIAEGDTDGDGAQDLILASSNTVRIYRIEGENYRPLNEFSMTDKGEIFSLGAWDFRGSGQDDIVITLYEAGGASKTVASSPDPAAPIYIKVATLIYRYQPEKGYGRVGVLPGYFSRVTREGVYLQAYADATAFSGPILRLQYDAGVFAPGPELPLPVPSNLYDFAVVNNKQISYGADGRIHVLNADGRSAWQSDGFFGMGESEIVLPLFSAGFGGRVPKRIPFQAQGGASRQFVAFQNRPILSFLPGLGFGSVDLTGFTLSGTGAEELWSMPGIPARLMDMTLFKDGRLALLLSPTVSLSTQIFDPIDLVQKKSAVMVIDTRER